MCIQFVRTALHRRERVVKAPWVQKTKVRNTSNTHSHEHTLSSTHPHTHRHNHPRMHQPTHPRRATAIQQSTTADAYEPSCCDTGISVFLRFSAIPGSERSVPGRPTYNAPRSPSWARHPLFAGDREGLLCGWDVEPPRDRGRPSGARDSQMFLGVLYQKYFRRSK